MECVAQQIQLVQSMLRFSHNVSCVNTVFPIELGSFRQLQLYNNEMCSVHKNCPTRTSQVWLLIARRAQVTGVHVATSMTRTFDSTGIIGKSF